MICGAGQFLSIFAAMCKKSAQIFICSLWFMVISIGLKAQQNDTLTSVSDTITVAFSDTVPGIDSLAHLPQDTIITDSTTIAGDSLKNIIFDSTYYSLYGHLFSPDDTTLIHKWKFYSGKYDITISEYDSTLNDFYIYHPAFRKSIAHVYLGANGLATESALFFEPNPQTDYLFLESFTPYVYQPHIIDYYNVKRPFTKFSAHLGPKEEQNIRILHTQNINPYFNGFFKFNSFSTDGVYVDQGVRNNTGVIGGSYLKGRFATHVNYIFSKINPQESGGITDHEYITDTTRNVEEIPTRLTEGETQIKDRRFFIDQKIGFVKTKKTDSADFGNYWFSLQYNYNHQKTFKIYTDQPDNYISAYTKDTLNLYAHNYSGAATFDSNYFESNNHLLKLNLEEIPGRIPSVGAYFGIGYNNTRYGYFNKDTLFNHTHDTLVNNYFLEAGIYRYRSKFLKFSGSYRFYLAGYKQNDMSLKGNLHLDIGKGKNRMDFKSSGSIEVETPDYFYQRYYSNHFRWENSFKPVKRNKLSASIHYPRFNLSGGVNYSLLKDNIFFNQEAIPEQESDFISVVEANIQNHLDFWRFNLKTKAYYQKTGNNRVMPLPEFAGYASLYYEQEVFFKHTGGIITIQLGTDVYYFSSYHAPAYNPATALFYNQSEKLIGNYPYLGAFFSVEIKRLRFYIRGQHLNYDISQRNYFASPNYPTTKQTVKYGLTWTFYN